MEQTEKWQTIGDQIREGHTFRLPNSADYYNFIEGKETYHVHQNNKDTGELMENIDFDKGIVTTSRQKFLLDDVKFNY